MQPGALLRGRWAPAVWVAVPVAIHLFVLARFWFNAPVLDDYDCILDSMGAMAGAQTVGDWIRHVFALQNEHRLAGTRLIPQILAWTSGTIDFRLLMLIGTAFVFGAFAFIWAEFREEITGPIAAAAAFLLLQWSYNEAFLMGSASTAHLGVVFFSVAGLYFALRPGRASAIACVVGGVFAAYSQANGLFVLPIAGIACFILRQRQRGVVFISVAAVIWALYFVGYARPPHHPSLLMAFENPVRTLQLFLIVIGGVVPSHALSQLAGAGILTGIAWIAWKGVWRRHPTVFLWIAFVLISAAAVAAARSGFGLHRGSRYAVNAALLMAMLTFAIYSLTRPWRVGAELAAAGAAAFISAAILVQALPEIRERAFRGRLLMKIDASETTLGLPRYAGIHHPAQAHAARILDMAAANHWYFPPSYKVQAPHAATTNRRPIAGPPIGVMDEVTALEQTVVLRGWTDIAAMVAERKFTIFPPDGIRSISVESLQVREDVAAALRRPDTLLSGFRIVAKFDSESEAKRAAADLCIYVEAPGRPMTEILRPGMNCR